VLERELEMALGGFEQDGPDLALGVLQREIGMSRLRDREVRDLPGHPNIRKGAFDEILDPNGKLRDGEDVAAG
jgi:hypothetical protein